MVAKIKAAVDARVNPDFVIVARSDAYLEYGVNDVIERGQAYVEAGADVFFPILYTSPKVEEELGKIGRTFNTPLMLTLTHYGAVAYMPVQEAVDLGYRLLVSPWGVLAAAGYAVREFMRDLKKNGTIKGFANRMIPFDDFTDLMGLPEINALESKYKTS